MKKKVESRENMTGNQLFLVLEESEDSRTKSDSSLLVIWNPQGRVSALELNLAGGWDSTHTLLFFAGIVLDIKLYLFYVKDKFVTL